MLVVVGLGNPGSQYADTRHNVGFMVVDELLRRAGARARRGGGDYEAARAQIAGTPALLVKPATYVNRTGRAVLQIASAHRVPPSDILAVVDDVYLPFGRLRLRLAGSAGGHNGLQSIVEAIGTDFPRLRIGVGAPPSETPLADHVLEGFPDEQRAFLPELITRAADAVERVAADGAERAMPAVNRPATPAAPDSEPK